MTVMRAQESMVLTTKDGILHAAHCALLQEVTSGDDVIDVPNRTLIEVTNVNELKLCERCQPQVPATEAILLRIPLPATPPGPPNPPDTGERMVG